MGWKQFQPFKMFIYTEDKNNKQNNVLHFAKEDVEPHFLECHAN